MTLHAASREALSFAKSCLDDDAGADPSAVGEDLLPCDLLTWRSGCAGPCRTVRRI